MKFDRNVEKRRKCRDKDTQRHRDKTCNAKMQDAMQDTVHNEHKQMGMPTPPKVLHHKHNCQSAQSMNNDKDTKEQERVSVVIKKDNEHTVKRKWET